MDIQQSELDNGLRVVTAAFPGFTSAAVAVVVRAGTRVETEDESGTAHVLEHMAFKGTTRRSALDIAEAVESLGATINAVTTKEFTTYYVTGLDNTVPEAIALLADVLSASRFDESELEIEKSVILREIDGYRDDPVQETMAGLAQAAYSGQPLGRPVWGRPEVISSLTRADLLTFIDRYYRSDDMVLIATGAVRHREVMALAARHFADLGRLPAAVPPLVSARYDGGIYQGDRPDLQQTVIALAFEAPPFGDPRSYAFQILANALGSGMSSPLFRTIRAERGLAYEVGAWSEHGSDHGLFGLYAATTKEHVETVLRLTRTELARLAARVEDKIMIRARNQRLVALAQAQENPF